MSAYLLDANVAIALTHVDHEHHARAEAWFGLGHGVALCPIVEGALVRFVLRTGHDARVASALLQALHASPAVEFWAEDVSLRDVDLREVTGHRQVTDSYLAALARSRSSRLATFDKALAARMPDAVDLIAD